MFSLKAGYITAISRYAGPLLGWTYQTDSDSFVTGLLDAEQDSKYKVSMYSKAQQIGLPALFVDIRHEAAHGEMPSLTNLREAAERAFEWLWDDYWKGLQQGGRDYAATLHPGINEDAARAAQAGGWTPWQGPWIATPIGVLPQTRKLTE